MLDDLVVKHDCIQPGHMRSDLNEDPPLRCTTLKT